MKKKVNKILVALFLSVFSLSLSGQSKMNEFIKACEDVESIEYTIHQKNARGRYGNPTIKATIFQQKANVKDVGFGNALMKATGTIKERGILKAFAFSYDGKSFQFEKGKSGIKKYNKPTRKTVMNLLQQHLFMLHIRHFSEKPYFPASKTRYFSEYEYAGEEVIKNKSYYKINAIRPAMFRIKDGDTIPFKKRRISGNYWLDKITKLPTFFTDNFDYKTITIKQLNKDYDESFFSLLNK